MKYILLTILLIIGALAKAQEPVKVDGLTTINQTYPFSSVDGWVYFTSNMLASDDIFRKNTSSGKVERLVDFEDTNESHVAVSHDGQQVAFTRFFEGYGDIYVYNNKTGQLKNVTNTDRSEIHPKFTHDGKKLIYNQQFDTLDLFEIIEYDLQTETRRNIFNDTTINRTFASYNPAGTRVVYVRWYENQNTEVSIANVDGTNEQNISNHQLFDGWPAWSPDGKKIVFASDRDKKYHFHLYIYDLESKNITRLTEGDRHYVQPVWSRDGKSVVAREAIERGLSSQIVKVNIN